MNKEFITGLLFGFFAPILILFLISIFYPRPMPRGPTLEYIKNNACSILMRDPRGCNNVSTDSTLVKDFDANKDGKKDSADTLQALCENYYGVNIGDQTACKRICGCSS